MMYIDSTPEYNGRYLCTRPAVEIFFFFLYILYFIKAPPSLPPTQWRYFQGHRLEKELLSHMSISYSIKYYQNTGQLMPFFSISP